MANKRVALELKDKGEAAVNGDGGGYGLTAGGEATGRREERRSRATSGTSSIMRA